jgi:hypothetical protein
MTRSHMRHIGVDEGSTVWLTTSAGAVTVARGASMPAVVAG